MSLTSRLRVGLVCPYSFDVPGGVQAHVRDLAEALIDFGHAVSVLAPADDEANLPPYVVAAGHAVQVPYNGSIARLAFGPLAAARVRRWLRDGGFDLLHVHEPAAPSLSLLACITARGPIAATFHSANPGSRMLSAASGALQPVLGKIGGRISVSASASTGQLRHLDAATVEIPNGVVIERFEDAAPLPGWPGPAGAVGFLGRFGEPRKGFPVLLGAFEQLVGQRPGLRLLVAGPGDVDGIRSSLPAALRERAVFLGLVSEADKARMLRSVDVYVAPNLGGESFGMILTEAMAAGTPIAASDLPAFRTVLDGGQAGVLFRTGDAQALTDALARLLADRARQRDLVAQGRRAVRAYDWRLVATRVLEVYEALLAPHREMVTEAR